MGSDTFIDIQVDEDARMCLVDLEEKLETCLKEKTPVFGVVLIIGSTEHGACDPVMDVVSKYKRPGAARTRIRPRFQERGLSFAVHCDAAWGGYFASTLIDKSRPSDGFVPYVPASTLQQYTVDQLENLQHVDTITIDPHKSVDQGVVFSRLLISS
jgi:glutamate/tyrosine decarboxylase-like PLP-dependent enzyme